jgi:hypothetical protein
MAVVRPLYNDNDSTSNINLRQMSDAQLDSIKKRIKYLYFQNPSVSLTYVSSAGNLGSLNDTRLQAGSAIIQSGGFAREDQLQDVSVVTVENSHLNQTISTDTVPADTNFRKFPMYYNADNALQAMSIQDMYDTFIDDVVNGWLDASSTAIAGLKAGGEVFAIHTATSNGSDYSAVSSNPIYRDTRADTTKYQDSTIPEERDQPVTVQNYYLLKNVTTAYYSVYPVVITDDSDIQELNQFTADAMFEAVIRYAVQSVPGFKLRYNINGDGYNCGSTITDTRLNGSGTYITYYGGPTDHRAQMFPNGTSATISTYNLQVEKS